jgi:hypothetical protein
VVIFTGNQAAIKIFQPLNGRLGAYIVAEGIQGVDRLQNEGLQFDIRRVPAYIGIWGNEAAD